MAKAYQRGEYLVEGAGHCAECHSSRGFMGNVLAESRYGGGGRYHRNRLVPEHHA